MENKRLLALCAITAICFSLTGCGSKTKDEKDYGEAIVLNVYNCADYIAEGGEVDEETGEVTKSVMEQFEEYCKVELNKNVKINYSTYSTNEDLYNQLKAGGIQYDLVCPSEYMIEKMIMNDMIEPLDKEIENYNTYGSKYIKGIFDNLSTKVKDTETVVSFGKYAVPYMWGTMGFMYNPKNVSLEDVSSWDIIWNENFKNKVSLKDSIRDTYITSTLHIYKEELKLAAKTLTDEEYNDKVTEIMNRCDDATLRLVEADLKAAKNNIYEFEVDTGKENIIKGKYDVNLCWSGDAVYALDLAEAGENEEGEVVADPMLLEYKIPEEGSNIWFDGWVMPKGANKELAQELMNFLCDPAIASQNMEYVGYTSAIAGQDMWALVQDWYEAEEGATETTPYDLTYFFKDSGIVDELNNPITSFVINTEEENRQLYAQYPDLQTIQRCGVMKDFGGQNDKVTEMWIRVKGNNTSWVIFVFLGAIVAFVVFFEVKGAMNRRARKRRSKMK